MIIRAVLKKRLRSSMPSLLFWRVDTRLLHKQGYRGHGVTQRIQRARTLDTMPCKVLAVKVRRIARGHLGCLVSIIEVLRAAYKLERETERRISYNMPRMVLYAANSLARRFDWLEWLRWTSGTLTNATGLWWGGFHGLGEDTLHCLTCWASKWIRSWRIWRNRGQWSNSIKILLRWWHSCCMW